MTKTSDAPQAARRPVPTRGRGQAGFTLIEMMISLLLSVALLVLVLQMFDYNSGVARTQNMVADMQQSLRAGQLDLVRNTRMTGRGGMPVGPVGVTGLGVAVMNDVPVGTSISATDDTTPDVLEETDVLTVRGVFESPIYQVNYAGGAVAFNPPPPAVPISGTINLSDPNRWSLPTNLQPLIDAVEEDRPEALIVVSPDADTTYAVVELDPDTSDVSDPTNLVIGFLVVGGSHSAAYQGLSAGGGFPAALTNIAYVGILEEYRYYIRRRLEVPSDPNSQVLTTLTRARVYPGTEAPWDGDATSWEVPLADDVFDLQVAYGIDTNNDGNIDDNLDASDEWLYNHSGDNDGDAAWNAGRLYYLRVNTLAKTSRRELSFQAPLLGVVEDHDYTDSPYNEELERRFRRRAVQTVIDLRNMG